MNQIVLEVKGILADENNIKTKVTSSFSVNIENDTGETEIEVKSIVNKNDEDNSIHNLTMRGTGVNGMPYEKVESIDEEKAIELMEAINNGFEYD